MAEFNEREFLQAYRAQPHRAFGMLMAAFRDRIFLFCLRAANRTDAEDLAQEVFIRVWKGLETFRADSSLSTWIYRIAWNVCATHLDRKGSAPETVTYEEQERDDGDEENPRFGLGADDPAFKGFESRQLLETLFKKIPAAHQLVLTLYYLQEQTYEEISAITGWPVM